MLVAIRSFGGMVPGVEPRSLRETQAQRASNAKLIEGDLQAWHEPVRINGLSKFGGVPSGGSSTPGLVFNGPLNSGYLPAII